MPSNEDVGVARETIDGLISRFTFARNDLLFTMSDNTRMFRLRDRSFGHGEFLFFLRTSNRGRRSHRPPSLKASAGNLRGSKAGLPTEAALAAKVGGARRDRTDDLLLAKQALSQLSYGPLLVGRPPSRTIAMPSRSAAGAKAGGPGKI
jgi:hypothetical protein